MYPMECQYSYLVPTLFSLYSCSDVYAFKQCLNTFWCMLLRCITPLFFLLIKLAKCGKQKTNVMTRQNSQHDSTLPWLSSLDKKKYRLYFSALVFWTPLCFLWILEGILNSKAWMFMIDLLNNWKALLNIFFKMPTTPNTLFVK